MAFLSTVGASMARTCRRRLRGFTEMMECPSFHEILQHSQLLLSPLQVMPMQTSSARKFIMWPPLPRIHFLLFFIIMLVSPAYPLALSQSIHQSRARWRRLRELQNMQPLNSNESKEFNGLMEKHDTYDASAFDASHENFKSLQNLAFSALASPGPAFYLDGPNHATTSTLLAAGFSSSELYTANIFPKTCSLLREKLPNVIQNNAADALVQNYHNVPFVGFYLDGCGGDPVDLLEMVEALFHRDRVLAPRFVVGFTLTRADVRGRSLGDRETTVLRCIARLCRENGYSPPQHVGDDPTRFGVDESLSKEEGGTMTQWVICEKII